MRGMITERYASSNTPSGSRALHTKRVHAYWPLPDCIISWAITGTSWCVAFHLSLPLSDHYLQADTIDKTFEKPLRQHLDTYKTIVNVRLIFHHAPYPRF